ncbi:cupin domain-containing protein [Solitalea canadensis]|uniref:Cupin domain-containing protein n=1 Tax=Solitalea canadensis (strain ATCC 29591 / DSM 3403 / JCM 21819 / LMG 8368 / NBRC 15130 / NCIMB 12057 / USAM 9D) TaxID=929556 RepID=H8KPM6_SOLCM|nr:hypothetical protein [Solitalea canadensis]AFD05924.1 hypothetical protein Solca_0806 [Solitalea canadensis DSM 3403]
MVIKELLEKLETSPIPVAGALHAGENFRVLVLAFKKGMILKEHKAHTPGKLTVVNGRVVYTEGEKKIPLSVYEHTDIPLGIPHTVEALEDSVCFLTQG